MTETRSTYHAPPNGRGIAWLTSRQVSAIVFAELRDLLDDDAMTTALDDIEVRLPASRSNVKGLTDDSHE